MKIKIQQGFLAQALSWTQSVVERKTTMPVLSNVLLKAREGKLLITATDLEVGVILEIEANVLEEGEICIQAKSLYEIVRELSSKEIEIEQQEQLRLKISAGSSVFKMVGLPAEEFPTLPAIEERDSYAFESQGLKEMMNKTLFAISTDESRYNLHGVYLEQIGENTLRMVATDGHRLSYVDRKLSQPVQLKKGVIVPKKGIFELKHLVSESSGTEENESIQLQISERNLVAKKGKITLMSRLIDGEFPNYHPVIPKPQEKFLLIDRQALMGALRRVSILIVDRSRGVKFVFTSGLLELSTSNPEMGEAREELPIEYKGERVQIGFNPRYFLDVLSALEDEKILLELNGEVGPCVIRSNLDPGFLSVVMPMRI